MSNVASISPNILREEDRARADFYALIARLFGAPADQSLIDALANAGPLAAEGDAPLANAWARLVEASIATPAEAAAEEYEALFIGMGKADVSLYGSWYQAGFMMEKPLAELRADLERLGFQRKAKVNEPEDHLAALADVMRMLVLERRDVDASSFFARHLSPWYGRCLDAVSAHARASYFKRVGDFARAFLNIEQEFVQRD